MSDYQDNDALPPPGYHVNTHLKQLKTMPTDKLFKYRLLIHFPKINFNDDLDLETCLKNAPGQRILICLREPATAEGIGHC